MDQYTRGALTFDVVDSGPEDGPVVVLLHGFPQTPASWNAVTPQLTAAGYRVLAPAQRGYVVGRVPRAAAHHFGRVVFQDQHGRFTRHARHFAVNEFVGNQIADDEYAAAGKAVDEPEEPLLALRLARQRMNRPRDQHVTTSPSIQLAAPTRLSAIASA